MDLWLIRHAAAEAAAPGESDDARALSDEGRRKFEREVKGLGRLGVGFDRIFHSSKKRAIQTAKLLAPLLDPDGIIDVIEELATAPSSTLLHRVDGERVALVGHEPHLSALAAWLVFGSASSGRFEIKKGGVVQLDGELRPGAMVIRSVLAPRTLRTIRR